MCALPICYLLIVSLVKVKHLIGSELGFLLKAGDQSNVVSGDEPLKTAKKIYNKKFSELSGNDIFKGDAPPSSAEKSLSMAKMREISGNDIFADGKVESRDYLGGVRKPPGGESSIALL